MHQPITVSLWAMPPLSVRNIIYEDIKKFAERPGASGAIFEPHVTLLGGIQCSSIEDAKEKAKSLQKALQSNGHLRKPLWCAFGSKVEHCNLWSQACCVVLTNHDTSGFDEAVQTCLRTLNLSPDTSHWTYPTPLQEPHLSLYYHHYNEPAARHHVEGVSVYRIPSFVVDRLELWCTNSDTERSTVQEDVHNKWYPIAVIPMAGNGVSS